MATHIIIFKEANEKYAKPEMFVCDATEADEIHALLDSVGNECNGPIECLSYTEFVTEVEKITLAELRERFAEQSEAEEEDAVNLNEFGPCRTDRRPTSE